MSIKHPVTLIDDNAINARIIVTSILGIGCKYSDGRKNGVRYKWLPKFYKDFPAFSIQRIENCFKTAGIKNYKITKHPWTRNGAGMAISVLLRKV